ncbi:hypothetical protein [Apibacter sp. B3813]|uniref:hypothetical protein n=2 Tax=Apibacter TaxID=1778601 RepID=UPI0013260089|nr:hypothetical protein [Apibacter sp. B3813]MXO23716.1 hypothetical protein [Apibacter sp. B3924]
MMKISKKEKDKLFHEYVVLSMLLLHVIDRLKRIQEFNERSKKFKENLEFNAKEIEELTDKVFTIKKISGSTYIQDLAQKVETVIRKNYVTI